MPQKRFNSQTMTVHKIEQEFPNLKIYYGGKCGGGGCSHHHDLNLFLLVSWAGQKDALGMSCLSPTCLENLI